MGIESGPVRCKARRRECANWQSREPATARHSEWYSGEELAMGAASSCRNATRSFGNHHQSLAPDAVGAPKGVGVVARLGTGLEVARSNADGDSASATTPCADAGVEAIGVAPPQWWVAGCGEPQAEPEQSNPGRVARGSKEADLGLFDCPPLFYLIRLLLSVRVMPALLEGSEVPRRG